MDVEIKIDTEYECPKIVIYTGKITEEIEALVEKLTNEPIKNMVGYLDNQLFLIDIDNVYTIYTENQKVYVQLEKQTYLIKNRLYEMEEKLSNFRFIRISNSEIVNFKHVSHLDFSISGTIILILKNGKRSYVSRRYISKIKKQLGI